MLDDVVSLCRFESSLAGVAPAPVPLLQTVSEVAREIEPLASRKRLRFSVEYRGWVPASVRSHPDPLRWLLMALLSRAIEETARGEIRLLIGLQSAVNGGAFLQAEGILILVPGAPGPAIDPAAPGAPGSEPPDGQRALRLRVCHRVASVLGGKLDTGNGRRGSLFTLTLPAARQSALGGAERAAERGVSARAVAGELPQARVLVADDTSALRELLMLWLRTAGLEVDGAENGQAAVRKALAASRSGAPYDLILMDVEMPELDGALATSELRKAGFRGPVVALTGDPSERQRRRCLRAGCDGFISKPIDTVRLLSIVSELIPKPSGWRATA
jgi:CheY-like chemotaxis protein